MSESGGPQLSGGAPRSRVVPEPHSFRIPCVWQNGDQSNNLTVSTGSQQSMPRPSARHRSRRGLHQSSRPLTSPCVFPSALPVISGRFRRVFLTFPVRNSLSDCARGLLETTKVCRVNWQQCRGPHRLRRSPLNQGRPGPRPVSGEATEILVLSGFRFAVAERTKNCPA